MQQKLLNQSILNLLHILKFTTQLYFKSFYCLQNLVVSKIFLFAHFRLITLFLPTPHYANLNF